MIVAKIVAGAGVAGYEDIRPAIVIEIGCDGGHGIAAFGARDARSLAHVGERAVAIVAVQGLPGSGRKTTRTAHDGSARVIAVPVLARLRRGRLVELQIVRHKKIQPAIAIIVEERAPGPPPHTLLKQSGLSCDIGKRAVAVVAIERILSPVSDEQIFVAVVVVVADSHSGGPSRAEQTGFFRNVGERAIAVVAVKTVRRVRGCAAEPAAIENENIHPAVVIVIDKSHAAAGCFDNIVGFAGGPVDHGEMEPRGGGNIRKLREERNSGALAPRQRMHPARRHTLREQAR